MTGLTQSVNHPRSEKIEGKINPNFSDVFVFFENQDGAPFYLKLEKKKEKTKRHRNPTLETHMTRMYFQKSVPRGQPRAGVKMERDS